MKLTFKENSLEVEREKGDKKYYGQSANGESTFLHAVKLEMAKHGYRIVKKRMYKDGHLVDDAQQYLKTKDGKICWYNDHWAISGLNENFNEGKAVLRKHVLK